MTRFLASLLLCALAIMAAVGRPAQPSADSWRLTCESEALVPGAALRGQIFRALDAAENAGTEPAIPHCKVRAAVVTVVNDIVLSGNNLPFDF